MSKRKQDKQESVEEEQVVPVEMEQPLETPAPEMPEATAETAEAVVTRDPNAPAEDVLLELRNLKKNFVVGTNLFGKPNRFLHAVDNVSFSLKKGKTLVIVGESGCGKTTMGRTILRLHEANGGEVWFNGQEVT